MCECREVLLHLLRGETPQPTESLARQEAECLNQLIQQSVANVPQFMA